MYVLPSYKMTGLEKVSWDITQDKANGSPTTHYYLTC